MRIYNKEKEDGLEHKLSSPVTHIEAKVKIPQSLTKEKSLDDLMKYLSSANIGSIKELIGVDQPDLALLVAILVSTGWNLNDDVFLAKELWDAKQSPEHKPIDLEHNSSVIIGHMVKSRVLDKQGNEISLDSEKIPEDFDIEVAGVIYKSMPGINDKVEALLKEASDGDMFVSMECYFDDFSYAFKDISTGNVRIVDRDEKTSFLTKHLRSFGGSGEFQGFKIGRVLKNIVFGGQGLVRNPANPDSIIKVVANENLSKNQTKGGVVEMDELNQKIKELEEALTQKNSEAENLAKEVASLKEKEALSAKNSEQLSEANKKLSEDLVATSKEKDEVSKKLVEITAKANSVIDELSKIKQAELANKRFIELSSVKEIKDSEKDAVIKELEAMTDDTFAVVIKYSKMNSEKVKSEANKEVTDVIVVASAEEKNDHQPGNDTEEENGDARVALATAMCLINRNEETETKGGE